MFFDDPSDNNVIVSCADDDDDDVTINETFLRAHVSIGSRARAGGWSVRDEGRTRAAIIRSMVSRASRRYAVCGTPADVPRARVGINGRRPTSRSIQNFR